MHRSTRFRRLAVALLVVLVLAVAARFARASSPGADDRVASPQITHDDKLFLLVGQR